MAGHEQNSEGLSRDAFRLQIECRTRSKLSFQGPRAKGYQIVLDISR